jgi:hypothetical protein
VMMSRGQSIDMWLENENANFQDAVNAITKNDFSVI